MKINIWITKQDAISGKITKYYNICPQQTNWPDFVQVSVSQDEFARLEDRGSNNSSKLTESSKNDWGGDHWLVDQYNRNREHKDRVTSKEEIPYIYERNPDTNTVYRRRAGDKHENREAIDFKKETATLGLGERFYRDEKDLEQLTAEMKKKTGEEFMTWFHKLTKQEQSKLAAFYND
jgi:hypothetical protein